MKDGKIDITDIFSPNVDEGIAEVTQRLKELTDQLLRAAKAASEYKVMSDTIEDAEAKLAKQEAESLKTRNELIKQTNNLIKLQQQKEKLDLEAVKIEEKKNKAAKEATSEYEKQSKSLTELRKKAKDVALTMGENSDEFKAAQAEVLALDKRLKDLDASLGQNQRSVGDYEKGTVSLRTQIREATQAIAQMALAGKAGTPEYNAMINKLGELKDTLGDVSAASKNAGDDLRNIKAGVDVLNAAGAAAQIAEGGVALFGKESEAVAETIKKLVAIQAVANGVQEVGNLLQKESSVMLAITNLQTKALTLSTSLQTAAESKNIIVRKAATAAQWLLNKAMSANPGVILIGVIGALVGAIAFFSRETKTATERQVELNEATNKYIDAIKARNEVIKSSANKNIQAIQDEINLAKAQGKSKEEITNLEFKLLQANKERADAVAEANKAELSNYDAIEKRLQYLSVLVPTLEAKKAEASAKGQEALVFEGKGIDEAIKLYQSELETITKRHDYLMQIKADQKAANDAIILSYSEQTSAINTNEDALKKLEDAAKHYEAIVLRTGDNVRASYKARAALIENQYQQEIIKAEGAAGAIELATAKRADAYKKLDEELKNYELRELEALNSIKTLQVTASKDQLADYTKLHKSKAELDYEEAERVKKLNKEKMESYAEMLTYINDNMQSVADIATQFLENEKEANQQALDEKLLNIDKETEARLAANGVQEQSEVQKIQSELFQLNAQLATETDAEAKTELQKSVTTKQQELLRAQIVADGEDRKTRAKQEAAVKEAQIARKQAIIGKAASIADIAIKTAVAIMTAFSQLGIFAAPAAAVIGVLGAAQAAAVALQPLPEIPQYKKGTKGHKGGLAVLHGGELVETPKGSFVTEGGVDDGFLYDLPATSKVTPADMTKRMIENETLSLNLQRDNQSNETLKSIDRRLKNMKYVFNINSGDTARVRKVMSAYRS